MRRILAVLACVGIVTSTQAQVITGAMFLPSPVGVVLSIGQWIIFETERTYYIEVLGEGSTPDEARNNGFRIAVEQAVGAIIASESEANNNRLTRDEIISYASGYITKYEIVKQEPGGLGVKTTMKVWIKKSSIANRLLNETKTIGDIEGAKAAVQLSTLQYERTQGDRLVQTVINDFYRRGFVFEMKPIQVKFERNRSGTIEVPFRLTWSRDYLKSLWEALRATAQDKRATGCWAPCTQNVATILISTGGFMGGDGGRLGFSDSAKLDAILAMMVRTEPTVMLTVRSDQNLVVSRTCHRWQELDNIDDYNVRPGRFIRVQGYGHATGVDLNGNFKLDGIAIIDTNPQHLNAASKAELEITPKSRCPNT